MSTCLFVEQRVRRSAGLFRFLWHQSRCILRLSLLFSLIGCSDSEQSESEVNNATNALTKNTSKVGSSSELGNGEIGFKFGAQHHTPSQYANIDDATVFDHTIGYGWGPGPSDRTVQQCQNGSSIDARSAIRGRQESVFSVNLEPGTYGLEIHFGCHGVSVDLSKIALTGYNKIVIDDADVGFNVPFSAKHAQTFATTEVEIKTIPIQVGHDGFAFSISGREDWVISAVVFRRR